MWSNREGSNSNGSDRYLKESLLRQLSHTVKEVQLYHSQTRITCSTEEGTSSLVTVLEAMFLHALKRSLLESAIRSVSVTDDAKPAAKFYEAVLSVTHKNTQAQLAKLSHITTDVGRGRAWIRLALNDGAMTSYLTALAKDRRVARFYRPVAFLRDRETMDTAGRLLEGLIPIPFDIPINSSLLNTWSSEPLLLSGLWAPALRATTQLAVDVAGGMEDEETCSIVTASSSVKSFLTLDEAQAIQIILDTPMPTEEHEQTINNTEVDKEINELEQERRRILERSFSRLVEDCSPQLEPVFPDSMKKEAEEREVVAEIQEKVISEPATNQTEQENDELSNVFPSDDAPKECEGLEKLQILEDNEIAKKKTMEETILLIPRELGLKLQRFKCAECGQDISLNFGPAILCNVTGEYLCENCHKMNYGAVPARVIFNWDHTKYLTGKRADTHLASIATKPIFDIDKMNPKLYSVVPEMREILQIRKQLGLLNAYLTTCKENVELPIRKYIFESVHLFSWEDLNAVPGGLLKAELNKIVAFGKSHVVACWICKEKGFICELCKDPQVIYPFDAGSIYRCNKCKAVYHGTCLTKGKVCPKCKRRKERESENS